MSWGQHRATALLLLGTAAAAAGVAYMVRTRQLSTALQRKGGALRAGSNQEGERDSDEEPAQHQPVRVPIRKDVKEMTSFSNYHDCVVTHVSLDLSVDFSRKVLGGSAILVGKVKRAGVSEMVLDTNSLTVTAAKVGAVGRPLRETSFTFGPKHKAFGMALRVALPEDLRGNGTEVQVEIEYETAPGVACTAVQWLPPEQTAGKVHPYLFTQNQPIHCRSMVPCQDAPAVKTTFDANITVPAPLVALMSAVSTGSARGEGETTFSFRQDVPVPSYLVALAVGNLESRDVGPRTRVWSEPSVVELAAYEFADTEAFISTAEGICGEYVWGRYDLLMLPPSFPYGGMENPCLTFVTPTLLAGDRSLANVVAHEVAHSWSGNLVTNATWSDFWLNESFTVFIERRIISKMFGSGAASLKQRAGWTRLKDAVDHFGHDHPFTRLHIPMEDVDPDDCFSAVPYEKGCALLLQLEKLVGGPEPFEAFLKAYMLRFQYGTVSWDQFKAFFLQYFADRGVAQARLDQINWDQWIHEPGLPAHQPELDTSLIDDVERAAEAWMADEASAERHPGGASKWSSDQRIAFLEQILAAVGRGEALPLARLDEIDAAFGFTETRNSEVLFRWCQLCLKVKDERRLGMVVRFVGEQGRMKFVRPLYRGMVQAGESGKAAALDAFARCRSQYHAIAQKMIARDLGVP